MPASNWHCSTREAGSGPWWQVEELRWSTGNTWCRTRTNQAKCPPFFSLCCHYNTLALLLIWFNSAKLCSSKTEVWAETPSVSLCLSQLHSEHVNTPAVTNYSLSSATPLVVKYACKTELVLHRHWQWKIWEWKNGPTFLDTLNFTWYKIFAWESLKRFGCIRGTTRKSKMPQHLQICSMWRNVCGSTSMNCVLNLVPPQWHDLRPWWCQRAGQLRRVLGSS